MLLGTLLIGFFATKTANAAGANGLFYGGGLAQLGKQALGVAVVGAFSFVGTWIIAKVLDKTIGLRVSEEDEVSGIDLAVHAETAYDMGTMHSSGQGVLAAVTAQASAAPTTDEAKVEA